MSRTESGERKGTASLNGALDTPLREQVPEGLLVLVEVDGGLKGFLIRVFCIQAVRYHGGEIVEEDLPKFPGVDGSPVGGKARLKPYEDGVAVPVDGTGRAPQDLLARLGGKERAAFPGAFGLE